MTYGQAYLSGWKETFNFSGRASRRQFWTFFSHQCIDRHRAAGGLGVWQPALTLNTASSVLLSFPLPRSGCC